MVDVEFGDYFITVDDEFIPRENVFIVAATLVYEFTGGFGFFIGPGYELERHRNFFVLRGGVGYELPIANDWHLAPEWYFDYRSEYFSWSLGMVVGKRF